LPDDAARFRPDFVVPPSSFCFLRFPFSERLLRRVEQHFGILCARHADPAIKRVNTLS
jgi:hypothetical protein